MPVSFAPPPQGYSDPHVNHVTSPDLPPLPPLPPEAANEENHPLMTPLDVGSLQSQNQGLQFSSMDNPRDVIGASGGSTRVPQRKESLYTITNLGGNGPTSSVNPGNNVPIADAPPSEISV